MLPHILGDRVTGVTTAPVEALFKRDDKEVVYVKRPEVPKVAESRSFFSSVFAASKDEKPAAKVEEKDRWKEKFELREVETGLASFDKAEIVKGLKAGEVIAVEDPTRPKEKKSNIPDIEAPRRLARRAHRSSRCNGGLSPRTASSRDRGRTILRIR